MTTETRLYDAVIKVLDDILYVEAVEQAFLAFIVHRPDLEAAKMDGWTRDLIEALQKTPPEQLEGALRYYMNVASTICSQSQLELLMNILEKVTKQNGVSSRLVCETLIKHENLIYANSQFWIAGFKLLFKLIDLVEYKGLREIMKGCCEKAKTLPPDLNMGVLPPVKVLLDVCERIMDRNASLVPGYLLVNELQKAYPNDCPHWRLSELFSDYIESFRACAQMVSIVGHAKMRPVVEHSGCPEHLVNPWKLDPLTLRYK